MGGLLHFVPVLGGWISVVGCMMPFVGLDPQLPSQLRVVLIVCMAVAQLLVPQVISLLPQAWGSQGHGAVRSLSALIAVLLGSHLFWLPGSVLAVPALLVVRVL